MSVQKEGVKALLFDKLCLLLLCVLSIAYMLWSVNSLHGFRYTLFYFLLITRLPLSWKNRIIFIIISFLSIIGITALLTRINHPELTDLFLTLPVIALALFLMAFFCRELFFYPIDLICGAKETECFFSSQSSFAYGFIFMRKWSCNSIRFYKNKDVIIELNYPYLRSECILNPPSERKLKVTYYRFSKIIMGWQLA